MFGAVEVPEHLLNLSRRERDREMLWSFCAGEFLRSTQCASEDLMAEECDGIEGLVLHGRRDLEDLCQVGEEQAHLRSSHLRRMLLVVKEDEPSSPVHMCFRGAGTQVTQRRGCSELSRSLGRRGLMKLLVETGEFCQ